MFVSKFMRIFAGDRTSITGLACLPFLLLIPALWALSAAFWGWLFMLLEGSLADHNIIFHHPWGYGICFLIGFPLSLALG